MAPKRCFILGNGPSLRDLDFALLEGQFCIAMNRIHRHPAYREGWRPDLYVAADYAYNPRATNDAFFHVSQGYPCWVRESILIAAAEMAKRVSWAEWPHVEVLANCTHDLVSYRPAEAWHPPHLCLYGGSMHTAVQIAVLRLGCKELVLLGCDMGYVAFPPGTPDPNHFDIEYQDGFPEGPTGETNLVQQHMWQIVKLEADAREVSVVNVTPGGDLHLFRRAALKEVVRGH